MSILNVDSLQNRAGISTAVSLSNLYGGVASAWVVFSTNNTVDCINESFNIHTLIDEGSGRYSVIFEKSLGIKGNGYAVLMTSSNGSPQGSSSTTTTQNRYQVQSGIMTPSYFRMLNRRPAGPISDNYMTMMFFAKT